MKRSFHLLIIDPQNDFCDLPQSYLPVDAATGEQIRPALPVNGAHDDMLRLTDLIHRGHIGLTDISVTLDSHNRLDIAHPTFWTNAKGQDVQPFTEITAAEVRTGKYQPRNVSARARVIDYLDALEAAGRYKLMIWPIHCEIGSWGHNVHADVRAAYNRWEDSALGLVNKVIKGTNPWTEHYSAIQAEVPDEGDTTTQVNRPFIELLAKADRVYISGEAGSHCVKATTEHIVANFGGANLSKLVLITDCMSPVNGFEVQYQRFLEDMAALGVNLATSSEMVPELLANASR